MKNFKNTFNIKLKKHLSSKLKILLDKPLIKNFQSRQFKMKSKNQY